MKVFISILALLSFSTLLSAAEKPNFIIVFTDDQGYADLSCFGGTHVATPHIDQLAKEGSRLTSFYVAAPVCTPSRAALMTGCYPTRINMGSGSDFAVLLAGDNKGLNPNEITIAEILKDEGYATALIGKWHLGDQPEFLPTRQGFDMFYGIPYSHDIHPFHPRQKHFQFPPLPFLDGETVIEMDPNADMLTTRLTERAVQFIEDHTDQPFFLYLPHPIPHKPLHVSPKTMVSLDLHIRNALLKEAATGTIDYQIRNQLFKQAIDEIDQSVQTLVDTLKANNIDEKTMIIFATDNGPAVGKATPLKGRKGSTNEGGMRVPAFVRWPGTIPAGQTCDELITAMDLLPTLTSLAGGSLPDHPIDGKDIFPVLTGTASSPHQYFFYHRSTSKGAKLEAVRDERWKFVLRNPKSQELYNLKDDIGEQRNVIADHPEVVTRLREATQAFQTDIQTNNRPAGYVENPITIQIKN